MTADKIELVTGHEEVEVLLEQNYNDLENIDQLLLKILFRYKILNIRTFKLALMQLIGVDNLNIDFKDKVNKWVKNGVIEQYEEQNVYYYGLSIAAENFAKSRFKSYYNIGSMDVIKNRLMNIFQLSVANNFHVSMKFYNKGILYDSLGQIEIEEGLYLPYSESRFRLSNASKSTFNQLSIFTFASNKKIDYVMFLRDYLCLKKWLFNNDYMNNYIILILINNVAEIYKLTSFLKEKEIESDYLLYHVIDENHKNPLKLLMSCVERDKESRVEVLNLEEKIY